jgi:ArsR family transcriptional regulator
VTTLEQRFMGLADHTRLRILNLLLCGELCGCDLEYVLGVPQSNVSRHLNYLKRVGLVDDHRHGFRVYYRLPETTSEATARLFGYLTAAFAADPRLTADLKKLKAATRGGACTISETRIRKVARAATAARSRRPAAAGR